MDYRCVIQDCAKISTKCVYISKQAHTGENEIRTLFKRCTIQPGVIAPGFLSDEVKRIPFK
jgi:hypothetical protein